MLSPQPLNVDMLHEELKIARRRGVQDSRLKSHASGVIELLYPAARYPDLNIHQRAIAAENLIVAAINALGGEVGHLLSVLLCVDPATSHLLLQRRRELAASRVGVLPATWQRGWWERQLLADLTAKIYRLHHDHADTYIPATAQPS
jgi:hypothetical protein